MEEQVAQPEIVTERTVPAWKGVPEQPVLGRGNGTGNQCPQRRDLNSGTSQGFWVGNLHINSLNVHDHLFKHFKICLYINYLCAGIVPGKEDTMMNKT